MMLPVWAKLENNTPSRTRSVMLLAVGISVVVYICTSFAGYASYGRDVKSNVLLSFPPSDYVKVLQLFVSFKFTLALPFQIYPFAESVVSVCRARDIISLKSESTLRTVGAFICGAIVVTVTMFVTDLGTVFAFIGSLLSTVLSYVIPGVCWLVVDDHSRPSLTWLARTLLCWALVPPITLISYYATL